MDFDLKGGWDKLSKGFTLMKTVSPYSGLVLMGFALAIGLSLMVEPTALQHVLGMALPTFLSKPVLWFVIGALGLLMSAFALGTQVEALEKKFSEQAKAQKEEWRKDADGWKKKADDLETRVKQLDRELSECRAEQAGKKAQP
jgi:hypothetical protein